MESPSRAAQFTNEIHVTAAPTASSIAGGTDISQRKVALIAALGLLAMAVLAPLALFGVGQVSAELVGLDR